MDELDSLIIVVDKTLWNSLYGHLEDMPLVYKKEVRYESYVFNLCKSIGTKTELDDSAWMQYVVLPSPFDELRFITVN